jgi:hypothetical protein
MKASATATPSKQTAVPKSAVQQCSGLACAPHASAALGARLGLSNFGVQRVLQAKLSVSGRQDFFEREADRVADQVMRMSQGAASVGVAPADPASSSAASPLVHRLGNSAGENSAAAPAIDAATEQRITSLSGRGSTMSPSLRSYMEPRFNADFSAVRIHDDANAHELARAVSAQAFTIGPNIVFGAGHYAPDTERGKRLLAHELTHTLQQGAVSTHIARSPVQPGVDPKKVGYSYTSFQVSSDKPAALARRGVGLVRSDLGMGRHLDRFVVIVVTDRVYVYFADAPRTPVAQFELTAQPPLRGVYMGGRRDKRYHLSYANHANKAAFNGFGQWGKGEWVTDYSTMTAADEQRVIGADIPVVIIPDQAQVAPPASNKTRHGGPSGNGAKPDAESSPGAKKTTRRSQGEPQSQMQEPLSGDEYLGGESPIFANTPAFPAHIKLSTALVPQGGSNDVTMSLYWGSTDYDIWQAVWNASTPVSYRWERWDITELLKNRSREDVARAQRQAKRDKNAQVDDQFVGHNRRQRGSEFADEIGHSLDIIGSGGLEGDSAEARGYQMSAEYTNLLLAPASALRTAGGHLVDTLWRSATRPDNEIQLEWNKSGHFLVRCVATPQEHEGRIYASSVATAFVEVRSPQYIAKNTLEASEALLLQLQVEREITTDPRRIAELDEQIKDFKATTHGSAVEALEVAIKNTRKQIERAAHSRERKKIEKQLETLTKQLDIAKETEAGLPPGPGGKPVHALRPRAAIVSQVTGTTFPLWLQMFQADGGPQPLWVLFDVTTPGDYLGHAHFARGRNNGEAIANAFKIFARQNDYGPGTVILRIPESIPGVAQRELVEKNIKGFGAATRQRLLDLVTVLTAASLVVPGAGMAASVLGGALAADHIARRWRNGTLEADASLVTDLLSVFGALGTVATQVSKLVVVKSEKAFALALETGDLAAIRSSLKTVRAARVADDVARISEQMLNYGGVAWGELQTLERIREINEAERDGKMTHSQASMERSKAVLGALQGRVLLVSSQLHQAPRVKPAPTRREGAPSPHAPGERAPVESPEWLFQRLARAVPAELPAPLSPRATRLPEGVVRQDITSAETAYHVYNEALASAAGREVGIFYDPFTGMYAVVVGGIHGVRSPQGDRWIGLLHSHPNPESSLTNRLPSFTDFASIDVASKISGGLVREFVEYALPDGTRGRTEYGKDPSNKVEPFYVRIHRPDGVVDPPLRFKDREAFRKYASDRAVYVESGSAAHRDLLQDAKAFIEERLAKTQSDAGQKPDADADPADSGGTQKAMARASGGGGQGKFVKSVQAEEIGGYRVSGSAWMEGGVFHWRIEGMDRIGGPTHATAPVMRFLNVLVERAQAAGATRLHIFWESIASPNMSTVLTLVQRLGGHGRQLSTTLETTLPLRQESPPVEAAPPRADAGRQPAPPQPEPAPSRIDPSPTWRMKREKVGAYSILGGRQMEGSVLHRRIMVIVAVNGPTHAAGPFMSFLRLLQKEAGTAGATSLKVTWEMVHNQNIFRMGPLMKKLGGTFRPLDATTVEITLPALYE